MIVVLIVIGVLVLGIAYWIKRARDRRELEKYSITPEALHALLVSNPEVLIFDVRLPLDLLADSKIIPGAKRIAPKEVLENPALIPQEKDAVVYCTCPSDKTSQAVLHKALGKHFSRIKFLKGAWMAGRRRAIQSSHTRSPFIWTPAADVALYRALSERSEAPRAESFREPLQT